MPSYCKVSMLPLVSVLLVLSAGCKNQRPDIPGTPSGPDRGQTYDTLTFQSVVTDPNGGTVNCRFSWDDGDTSDWIPVLSRETATAWHAWRSGGEYLVRAQARDMAGLESVDWSSSLLLRIGGPPGVPRLEGPGSILVDSVFTCSLVATDPDFDEVQYIIDWSDGSVDTSMPSEAGRWVKRTHIWTDAKRCTVRAMAIDNYGMFSDWSEGLPVRVSDPFGPGTLKWKSGTGGRVASAAAVGSDGAVYIGSEDSVLYVFNQDGSPRWSYRAGGGVMSAPAIAEDGAVVFGALDGRVYALDPGGALRWRFETRGAVSSSPAVAFDGSVYIGSGDSCIYAINVDGSERWHHPTMGEVLSSPGIGVDGTVYCGSQDGSLYSLDPTGQLLWTFATQGEIRGSPAIGGRGTVYVTSLDGMLYAVQSDGTEKWRYAAGSPIYSSAVIGWDGVVYVGSDTGKMHAVYDDGVLRWIYDTNGPISSTPARALDGTIYFGSGSDVLAIDSEAGRLWRFGTGGWVRSSPTVAADGTVYVGSDDFHVYAIRGGSPLENSPWPKFRRDAENTGRAGGR